MRIVKAGSLAVVVVLTLVSSVWADSVVTPSAFQADLQVVQTSISKNLGLFQKSPSAQLAFLAGEFAGAQALLQNSRGNTKGAQVNFQTAITDFNKVLKALGQQPLSSAYAAVPDAGSLALLGCCGIAIFGALRKRFAN